MSFFKKLFGISVTKPAQEGSWKLNDGTIEIDLDRAPELSSPNGALRLEGEGLDPRMLVIHGVDGQYHAYKNNCACSGWRIDPVPGEEKVQCCTLASSTYDYTGKRVSGPAKDDLQVFPVEAEGKKLTIKLD